MGKGIKKSGGQSFEYGATILLISTVLVKVIGALFKIPLQRFIGALGFGYFSSAYDLFLPIYALSMAGLPVAVSRIVAEDVANKKFKQARRTFSVAKKAFLITGITGLVAMIVAAYPYAYATTTKSSDLHYIAFCVFAIAPSLLFCCLMSAYRGYYEGLRNMYPTAVSDVIEALGKLFLGLGFAIIVKKLTGSVELAAAGALFGIMVGAALGLLYLVIRHRVKGDGISYDDLALSPVSDSGRKILKSLIIIAIPVVLSSLATNITLLIDTTMVKWQLKNVMNSSWDYISTIYKDSIIDYNLKHVGTASVLTKDNFNTFLYGIRGEAYTLFNLIPTLTSVLGVGAIPVLTTSWTQKNKPLVKKNVESILRTTALIAMPAGIGVSVLAKNIMTLLYGDVASIQIGTPLLVILGIAAVFAGLAVPITSMLQAIGKQNIPVRNIIIGATLKVVVNFILVERPEINIKGAPIGTLCCYATIFILNLISIIKYSKVVPNFMSTTIKPLISAIGCGATAFLVSGLTEKFISKNLIVTAISIIAAALVYIILLMLLKTLSKEDIEAFPKGDKIVKIFQKLKVFD